MSDKFPRLKFVTNATKGADGQPEAQFGDRVTEIYAAFQKAGLVIGAPSGTPTITVEQLKKMNCIGIYQIVYPKGYEGKQLTVEERVELIELRRRVEGQAILISIGMKQEKKMQDELAEAQKEIARLKGLVERQVDTIMETRQTGMGWREKYINTRDELSEAQAEIVELEAEIYDLEREYDDILDQRDEYRDAFHRADQNLRLMEQEAHRQQLSGDERAAYLSGQIELKHKESRELRSTIDSLTEGLKEMERLRDYWRDEAHRIEEQDQELLQERDRRIRELERDAFLQATEERMMRIELESAVGQAEGDRNVVIVAIKENTELKTELENVKKFLEYMTAQRDDWKRAAQILVRKGNHGEGE
jgi:chromosome segregation ATPase